jgi:hypothetical protein
VVPPLFDPQILPAPPGKLLIRGIELAVVKQEIYEHEQLWLCTPVSATGRSGQVFSEPSQERVSPVERYGSCPGGGPSIGAIEGCTPLILHNSK